MVDNFNETKLFVPENVSAFAKKKCKLLYTVLGEAIPNAQDGEYATIGLSLSPLAAVKMCKSCMGDAIEVWVIDGDTGIMSEKWEPQYFQDHFAEVVEYSSPRPGGGYDDDEDEDDEPKDSESVKGGIGIEMPQEIVLGKSLMEILECEQILSKTVAATSYMTGHPIDVNGLLDSLHSSVAEILKAFAQSKGGCEPKFRKKNGIMVPYWTKTQIKTAKKKA